MTECICNARIRTNPRTVGLALEETYREHDGVRLSLSAATTLVAAFLRFDAEERAEVRRRTDEHLEREAGSCGGLS